MKRDWLWKLEVASYVFLAFAWGFGIVFVFVCAVLL